MMSNVEIFADQTPGLAVPHYTKPFLRFVRYRPGSQTGELHELWKYRELLFFLAWRDVKVRYKQAALGAGWAVLQPLLAMIVFTVFFGKLVGVPGNRVPYPLFAYCALILWTYFATVIGQAGQCLVANQNLITKIYFPRLVLPVSAAVSGLIDFTVGLGFLVVLMAYYHVHPDWSLLWAPVFLAGLFSFTVGVSLILSALNVRFRDVKYVVPFMIQLGLFVTPVIYSMSFVPKRFQTLVALNPLTGIIEGFRMRLRGITV